MSSHDPTRTRVLHWFVRGGEAKGPDGKSVTIDVDPVVVGRDEGAALVVADPEVSAFHCELRAMNEGVLVKDLGSTNGTFIGALRVLEALVTSPVDVTIGGSKIQVVPTAKHRVDVGFADRFGPLVGSSPKMRRIYGVLERVAKTPLSVLILGETGTGKELVAKALHEGSDRKDGPFVVVDCGSIPPTLAESILFGHEKGSFTGASERRKGALAEADGGTLFFDELGELPIELQPKLLRAIAERQVKRVGASQFEPIDVRIVAATRRDLGTEMNAGRFRSASATFRSSSRRSARRWATPGRPPRSSRGSSSASAPTIGPATCASSSTSPPWPRPSPRRPRPSTTCSPSRAPTATLRACDRPRPPSVRRSAPPSPLSSATTSRRSPARRRAT